MKRTLSLMMALGTLATTLASSSAQASTRDTPTPSQILATALRAARAQRSVVSSVATSAFGVTITGVATSGATSGVARVSANGHTGEVRDLGNVLYARFDAALVGFEFRSSATSIANKWIAVPKASRYFANLALGVTLPSVLRELTPVGPLRVSTTTVRGVRVLALSGRANTMLGVTGGSQTLYLSTKAPHLPVGARVHASESGVPLDVTIQLAKWGVGLRVGAPAVFTPISATALK